MNFTYINKHKLLAFVLILIALLSLIFCVAIFISSAGSEESSQSESSKPTESEMLTHTFSPQSEKSLEYKSLGNSRCAVVGIGGFEGSKLNIPEKSPYGETVVMIGKEAFKDCSDLVSIDIPATVQIIEEKAFLGCSSLVLINVDIKNANFSSSDGMLYSKSKTTLICCPPCRIGEAYLINPSVKHISSYAFSGIRNLRKILYAGSTTEFEQISVGIGNNEFLNLPITCNYTGNK